MLTSAHRPLVIKELSMQNYVFCTHTIDYRLKEISNSINYFIKILKEAEHLDITLDENNEEGINCRKFFKPRFRSASELTPDNTLTTALEHCNSNVHVVDYPNVLSINNILFSNIRKVHYSYVIKELTLQGAVFERTKVNSKGKEVNVDIKDLVNTLKFIVYPNENELSENMSQSKYIMFKSFKPTYLMATEWTNLLNVNTIPNPENQE